MIPSPFPPFCGLSCSARARKPLRKTPGGGAGWGLKLPNNSPPLSIVPFPFRSSTRNASSDPDAVHAVVSPTPSLSRSKLTPEAGSVRSNPLPVTSMRIGLSPRAVPPPSYSHWQSGQECCHQPIFCGHVLVQNPLPPVLSGVGDGARDGTGGGYELFSVF